MDVNGGKHDQDFEDQADMCEIMRTLKESGKIEGMGEGAAVTIDIIDHISCPGDEGQTQICAVYLYYIILYLFIIIFIHFYIYSFLYLLIIIF